LTDYYQLINSRETERSTANSFQTMWRSNKNSKRRLKVR